MTRNFWLTIVCILIAGHAYAQHAPLSDNEIEVREERLSNFNQPIPFRMWELVEDTVDQWKNWELVDNYSFGINRGSLSMITDLSSLHPYFRDKVLELVQICKSKGIEIAVVETYRTPTKQTEYKRMGRRYTRSSAGQSKHQYGLAIDIVPVIDSIPQWRNMRLWRRIGPIGERLGLRWGGRWRRLFDPGHFEWTGGLHSADLMRGKRPAVPNPDDYPCLEEDIKALQRHWNSWEIEQSAMAVRLRKQKALSASAATKVALRGGQE